MAKVVSFLHLEPITPRSNQVVWSWLPAAAINDLGEKPRLDIGRLTLRNQVSAQTERTTVGNRHLQETNEFAHKIVSRSRLILFYCGWRQGDIVNRNGI